MRLKNSGSAVTALASMPNWQQPFVNCLSPVIFKVFGDAATAAGRSAGLRPLSDRGRMRPLRRCHRRMCDAAGAALKFCDCQYALPYRCLFSQILTRKAERARVRSCRHIAEQPAADERGGSVKRTAIAPRFEIMLRGNVPIAKFSGLVKCAQVNSHGTALLISPPSGFRSILNSDVCYAGFPPLIRILSDRRRCQFTVREAFTWVFKGVNGRVLTVVPNARERR